MMTDRAGVLDLAKTLAAAFQNSPEMRAYRLAKDAVFRDPALTRRLTEYKKAHLGYRLREMSGAADAQPDFDEEKVLSNAYSDLMLNGLAREFLERESEVFGLVNGINEVLGEVYGEVEME